MDLFNFKNSANPTSSQEYDKFLLEQYKNIATIIENTTHRRININAFFVGILTTFLAFIGIGGPTWSVLPEIIVTLSIFAFILTLIWQCSIRTYMHHNLFYYNVMQQIEKRMAIQYYRFEWETIGKFGDLVSISKKETTLTKVFGLMFLILPTIYLLTLGWEIGLCCFIILFAALLFSVPNLLINLRYDEGEENLRKKFGTNLKDLKSNPRK